MTAFLQNTFSGPVLAILVVAACIAYSVLATRVGRRLVSRRFGRGHNEVGGMILTTVGVVYAVLLAFAIIALWERRAAVEQSAEDEAGYLIAAYRDAGGIPDPIRQTVRTRMRDYAQAVIDKGYPALATGVRSSESRQEFVEVFAAAQQYVPQGASEEVWYSGMVGQLNQASEARTKRLSGVFGALPAAFWGVLLLSTALTLALGAFISMEDERYHMLFMVDFSIVVGALLFLGIIFDRPFSGDYALRPHAFEAALDAMHAIAADTSLPRTASAGDVR
jgi:uncharacterized protein DUF4239